MTRLLLAAALLLGVPPGTLAAQEPVRILGFFTLELEGSDKDEKGRRWTFDQHHFNVITIFDLSDGWRAFGEIEWEHGTAVSGSGIEGQVALERGWIEYHHSERLQIRAGKFLPPFGIYNLRHDASPTYLMTFLPGPIYGKHANTTGQKQRLYAKFGTGLQLLGHLEGSAFTLRYAGYVTNGRGSSPGDSDDNRNKGLGGRVILGLSGGAVQLGASAYKDRNGTAEHTSQTSLAADVRVAAAGFQFESEFLVPRIEWVDPSGALTDTYRTGRGFYVQASRRLADKLTPFVRYETYDTDVDISGDREHAVVAGVNLSVTSRVYLKGETQFHGFEAASSPGYRLFAFSLAAAF